MQSCSRVPGSRAGARLHSSIWIVHRPHNPRGYAVTELLFEIYAPAECYLHASQAKYGSSGFNGPVVTSVDRLADNPILSDASR